MKKVLIIGPKFHGYNESIEKAFKNLGFESRIIEYLPGEVASIKERIQYELASDKNLFFEKVKNGFNKKIIASQKSFQPDLIFIIQGNYVYKDTLAKMPDCKKVLWMMDSIFRAKGGYELRHNVDCIFLFEKTDIQKLWESDKLKSWFMPLALDEEIYFPAQKRNDIDILFIGTLYKDRIHLLEKVAERFKNNIVRVYGRFYSPLKRPFYHLFRKDKKIFLNKTLSPKDVNQKYNQTRICLNIHHDQSIYGVNQRFFEILGSKSFQLVNDNPYIGDNFSQDEVMTYTNIDDMFEKIEKVLSNEVNTSEMVEKAYKKVICRDTFTKRISQMLEILNSTN